MKESLLNDLENTRFKYSKRVIDLKSRCENLAKVMDYEGAE